MSDFEEKIISDEIETPANESKTPQADETPPSTPSRESRARIFLRNLVRWTLTVLIAFGLGALTIYLVYLAPARKDLDLNSSQLDEMTQEVDSLKVQLADVKENNQGLEDELKTALVRVALLDTISDVRAASLSVANDDYPGALLSLKEAALALEQLSETISTEQQEIVTAFQENLGEIENEVKSDPKAASVDLDRLTTNLIKLENSILR